MPIVTKLSAKIIQETTCPPGMKKLDLYCQHHKGLLAEIRASGGVTLYYKFTGPDRKQHQLKIGSADKITFAAAVRKFIKLRSEVELGGDPAAKKKIAREVPTYAQLAKIHLDYSKCHLRSWKSVELNMRVHLVPRWGNLPVTAISALEITKWLKEKRDDGLAPATTEKLRVLLNRSFELALQWSTPGVDSNPVRGVPRLRLDNARQRYLSAQESTKLLAACERSSNPQLKPIVHLLLLTAARRNELLMARWEHVNIERRSWFIPLAKTGKRHVPLSQAAIDIINELPRYDGNPWLLPNLDTGRPFVSIKRAWSTARDEAGLSDVRLHDLRHSAASFMINSGIDLFAVGKVLGHRDVQSSQRYSHLTNDTLLAAVEAGAAKMKV